MGDDKLDDESYVEETKVTTTIETEDEDEFEPDSIRFPHLKKEKLSSFSQYDFVRKVPLDHGIMIMLQDDASFDCMDSCKISDGYQGSNHSERSSKYPESGQYRIQQNRDQDSGFLLPTSAADCSCLKLKIQKDANIPQFHPNICVPSSLLEDPSKLVKYGGGGSGVTVFGGYHPDLGSLVMKHGGHKDLIELVSLAKIERELSVRAKWKIDKLERDRYAHDRETNNNNASEHGHEERNKGKVSKKWAARSTGIATQMIHVKNIQSITKETVKDDTGEPSGETDQHSAKLEGPRLSRFASNPLTQLKKIAANPLLLTISSMKNVVRASVVKRNNSTGTDSGKVTENTRDLNNPTRLREQMIDIQNATNDMKRRIPSFRMIYISPMHLRERADELKNSTFHSSIWSVGLGQESGVMTTTSGLEDSLLKICIDNNHHQQGEGSKKDSSKSSNGSIDPTRGCSPQTKGRTIDLFFAHHVKSSSLKVHRKNIELCFGGKVKLLNDTSSYGKRSNECLVNRSKNPCSMCHSRTDVDGSDGYASLMAFVHKLHDLQRLHNWKVTLAQQTIGENVSSAENNDEKGNDSKIKPCTTASSLLVQGKLEGQLLHHLIDEEIRVIKNLQLLTMPEELDVSEEVKTEFEDLKSKISSGREVTAADVSSLANTFVGKAIHKNFHPINGRFVMLWQFGKDLASKKIHLKPKEVVPAKHLENLFSKHFGYENGEGSWIPKNSLDSTFVLSEEERADLSSDRENYEDPFADTGLDQWKSLLELALSMDHPSATNRIWTCGLTDGGLHNLFLNEENLWMFDLGEPSLEPVPAFLTKFLMSFFHALGMEENEKGDWVVRFEQDESGKLRLTEKTKELLPKVIAAFNITVDRLIKELFEGYEKVRVLLVRYVVMQLISDSAFCIEKWRTKGGGDELRSDHQYYLEKWLWRALWDIYASEELRRRYLTRMMFKRQLENRHLDSFLT